MKRTASIFLAILILLSSFTFVTSAATYTSGNYTYSVNGVYATILSYNNDSYIGGIAIPETLGGYPVVVIGENAFEECSMRTVIIPDTVESIGDEAFYWCESLRSVTIPTSLTYIGYDAFMLCGELEEVYYRGTETQRNKMTIKRGNFYLEEGLLGDVVWHYQSCIGMAEHTFTNSCDTTCGCGFTRKITHSYGKYKYNGDATITSDGTKTRKCTVCGKKSTVTATGTKLKSPLNDIDSSSYCYKATVCAIQNNITAGTSETTFSPNDACTRGQIVTFLWRAAGSPSPKNGNNPFKDVKKSQYYYKAVLWAVENGITTGTSKTTFEPNASCTRGQVVTFLWRAKGSPSVSSSNPFTDIESNQYYYNAVLWAVKNKITTGTSSTAFSPDDSCTRGQIVTFLYRCYN